jgi:hypothetical protein
MPGLNGTGPQGNGPIGGRRFRRCHMQNVPSQEPATAAQPDQEVNVAVISQDSPQKTLLYGRGRGGVPCGCGPGLRFSGARLLSE